MTDMPEISDGLRKLRGWCGIPCTTGHIQSETHVAFSNMRDWNSRHGLVNIEYGAPEAKLVESARDAICTHALEQRYDYILMVDGDAAPFETYSLGRMLQLAFEIQPAIDVVGAYCQVKGAPYLPTIDTGTGTWQAEPAYQGTLPVIRTGGHFLLIKTAILRKFGPPWFRTRQALTAMKILQEFDNYSRTKLDGKNPLRGTVEWETLMDGAKGAGAPSSVGEDSGFCDSVRAVGGHIVVDTDLIVGHVGKHVILPPKLIQAVNEVEEARYARVGVKGYR